MRRSSANIIRAIRQISLNREWERLRRGHALPNIQDFEPDERVEDGSEISLNRVVRDNGHIRYRIFRVGERIQAASPTLLQGHFLDEVLNPAVIAVSQHAWDTAVIERLPVYVIIDIVDANAVPLTMEHLYLPFSENHVDADYLLVSINFLSEHARYQHDGLFDADAYRDQRRQEFLIDPAMTFAEHEAQESEIVFV